MPLITRNTFKLLLLGTLLAGTPACNLLRKTVQPAPTTTQVAPPMPTNLPPSLDTTWLESLLKSHADKFGPLLADPAKYRIQIFYTQIDRDSANRPSFTQYAYRPNAEYTYPASTVKLPAAVLALEKLNQLSRPGLDLYSNMYTMGLRPAEKPVYADPTSRTGKPSVSQYIRKILLVSDNDAHNRLYEFLGQRAFNERLHQLGFTDAQMTHRLSIALTDEENRTTNPIWFTDAAGKELYRQPYQRSDFAFAPRTDLIGKGYMGGAGAGQPDTLVRKPFDLSQKNRWPLGYAHQLTQWLMFPESQPADKRLLLTPSDYQFLRRYMGMFPAESDYPAYPAAQYWPSYVKFLLAGSQKGEWPLPGVRVFNKVGNAYGHLLDAAYIVDFERNVEFLLSASIYCNSNEILNDNTYDYDTVGFPFMEALGKLLYNHEVQRPRRHKPNLSAFQGLWAQ